MSSRGYRWRALAAASCAALALSGCGGGGSSSGGQVASAPAAPVNTAPSFTSSTTASVIENTGPSTGIYQAAATDAEGSAVTYSISGGTDAGKFAITSAGVLTFVSAPNFDLAGDADGDNVYQVTLSASDGQLNTSQNLVVTVTNDKEGVRVRRIATGFAQPTAISVVDATHVLVAEKAGAVYLLDTQAGTRTLLFRVTSETSGSKGVQAVLATNNFATNGEIYVLYNTTFGSLVLKQFTKNLVSRYDAIEDFAPTPFGVSAPNYDGGGWLGIVSGNIALATSDAGGAGDPTGSAQDPNSKFGKLLIFSPNPDPFAGAAPQPFITRIVAAGIHHPTGGDVVSSGIYVTDRGQDVRDELNLFPLPTPTGGYGNYGWPFKEGTETVRAGASTNLIDPITEYARGSGPRMGRGIAGEINYRGSVMSLVGNSLLLDSGGRIYAVPFNRLVQGGTVPASAYEDRTLDFVPDAGMIDNPVASIEDGTGNVYIVDGDGEIFRLSANGA